MKTRIVVAMTTAMVLFGAVTVSVAFAESEWLVSAAPISFGEKFHVEYTGTIIFEDMGKGSPTTLECVMNGLGVVEAAGRDMVESFSLSSCKTLIGTCSSPAIVAEHLPWPTEIILVGGEARDRHTGTGGEAGYKMTCFGILHDTCLGEFTIGLENMPIETPPDVLGFFSATLTGPQNCTLGGTHEGLLIGEVLIFALEGLPLAVS